MYHTLVPGILSLHAAIYSPNIAVSLLSLYFNHLHPSCKELCTEGILEGPDGARYTALI